MKKVKKVITLFLIIGILLSTFIPINIYAEQIEKGVVTANSVRFRQQPKVESGNIITGFNAGTKLLILGTASKGNGCEEVWYYAEHKGTKGYICSEFVKKSIIPITFINASFQEQLQAFPESYHSYLIELNREYPTWNFLPLETKLDFSDVVSSQSKIGKSLIQGPEYYRSTKTGSYNYETNKFIVLEGSNWYAANEKVVAYYLDPRNFLTETNIFMFESLTYNAEIQTKEVVDGVLNSDFLKQYSDIFINAALEYDISPIHLAARVRQEVGANGSVSTDGRSFEYNDQSYSGLYNFFNIGASTSPNPVLKGLIYANGGETGTSLKTTYGRPWTSPEKSIMGGADFLTESYINKGQTTLYLQKYNVNPDSSYALHTHQYMTNVKAPYSESLNVARGYVSLDLEDEPFTFTIPVFNNMPLATSLPTSGTSNNYLTVNDIIDNIGIQSDNQYLSGIGRGTEVSTLKNNITGASIITQTTIKDNNDNLKENGIFFTGDKIMIDSGNDIKTYTIIIKGDINGDGEIDLVDLLKTRKHILGFELKDEFYRAADINDDGKVDILDLLLIRKHLLKDKLIV